MPEAGSLSPGAAVDIASRLKRIEAGSNRLYHRDFMGLSWLASYVADVDMVCAEVERLKAQVAARAEVIELARVYRMAADESEDDGEDERTMDAGYAFFKALASLDAFEHAQRNAQVAMARTDPEWTEEMIHWHGGAGLNRNSKR